MSKDGALASAAAGLMLRDLFQPFTGITTAWRNRAALIEDGWIEAAGVYGTVERPMRWSELGDTLPWLPLLVLNASSLTDGCRVLLANVESLPAATGSDCGAIQPGREAPGAISAAIDPFPGLQERADDADHQCDRLEPPGRAEPGMRVVTAALLSARFMYLTPSGALLRCLRDAPPDSAKPEPPRRVMTYALDGGYYENSGLFTLLQMWMAIEPRVRQHNEHLPAGGHPITPWFLVADNHYRSGARAGPPRRPFELLAPIMARGRNGILSQAALEQTAASAMGTQGCAEPDTVASRDPAVPGCFLVVAPTRMPSVAAPLGWVLSETSRADLDRQLGARLSQGGRPTDESLRARLRQLSLRDRLPGVW
jgi:hypothetical protein